MQFPNQPWIMSHLFSLQPTASDVGLEPGSKRLRCPRSSVERHLLLPFGLATSLCVWWGTSSCGYRKWLINLIVIGNLTCWVCLKMLCTPLYPMVLLIIKLSRFKKWLAIIGNIPNIFRQTQMKII